MTSLISCASLPNIQYCINVDSLPPPSEKIDSDTPFSVVSLSLVRDMDESFDTFKEEIKKQISESPSDTLLIVLPEYCWRLTHPSEVFEFIDELKCIIPKELTIVLGTFDYSKWKVYE